MLIKRYFIARKKIASLWEQYFLILEMHLARGNECDTCFTRSQVVDAKTTFFFLPPEFSPISVINLGEPLPLTCTLNVSRIVH